MRVDYQRLCVPYPARQRRFQIHSRKSHALAALRFASRSWILLLLLLGLGSFATNLSAATYGQEVLAAVLLAEARGEGEVGMRAVAEVVRRRADAQGVSMLVVLKPGAFSSLNGTNRDALLRRFHRHAQFPQALEIARLAYNRPEALGNLTRGANHFTHKRERPYWSDGYRPVVIIGNHAFYRLPVSPG
jgi:N-acetylmuramoyl-L-alanine amidase